MLNLYRKSTQSRFLGVLFLISLVFCLSLAQINRVSAQTPNATQLVQQGIERYKAGDFRGAIAPWQTALNFYKKTNNRSNEGIVRENLARAYQQLGQTESALLHWERVTNYYRATNNLQQYGRALTEQAQTYSNLGQPRKAIAYLETALQVTQSKEDKGGEVAALGSLGEAYRLRGDYNKAIQYLEQAKKINESTYQSRILNSLGNTYLSRAQLENLRADSAKQLNIPKTSEFQQKAINNYKQAWSAYQSSLQFAQQQNDRPSQMQTLLNLIKLDRRFQDEKNSADLLQTALTLLDKLPNSRNKVYAAIDLANLSETSVDVSSALISCSSKRRLPDSQANSLLQKAVKTSQNLGDDRSLSFALGALGRFHECRQEYKQALEFTQKALWAADQKLKAQDSLYLWEWQAGRILKEQGKQPEAIAAYYRAYKILEQIKGDILLAERDLQFDFRDVIKPLYSELAQLRLELASLPSINIEKRNQELGDALTTIDSLKIAELQNYFGNDCILTAINEKSVEELLEKDTAVFSSIILDKGVAILLSLPNGEKREKRFEWIQENGAIVNPNIVIQKIEKFREGLFRGGRKPIYDTTQAQEMYDWIIRPFEKDLNSEKIKTLVFIQDGVLRTVPMAALYNKTQNQYLVEKYAIATTPSLKLTAPKIIKSQENRALILALTKDAKIDGKPYSALPNIPLEILEVQKQFPNNKPLVDEAFKTDTVNLELNKTVYPIIHIATHAQFGTIVEDSFLVTGNNNKLTISDLEIALRQVNRRNSAVDLLTLTACQTALGDDRAALGLAGVAVQAGARSALASLWSVPDESTFKLVTEFYSNLKSGMSKAKALQAAELKLLQAKKIEDINDQYDNPAFWAPFILIGNWL